ncbi:LlaJI family restriction endonuclease [Fibrobacter sp.]|uniref:LlaJI family restriction endonuclease n=1 Tax=Fibrobacter sp. TaxID=35828 RepID=UPI00260F3139|nr:LlaJI family restriction endonuclease [Fibrobacter sp.]MDD5942810.1 LlaJI family restriction endonuclease [Fibrobacter sp.]
MPKINDICHCDAKTDSEDEFVGIRCIKANDGKYETRIDFPMGYFKDEAAVSILSEENLRENVMNLFSVLSDADLMSNVREDSSIAAISDEVKETAFPMLAYLNVIRNYLDNGYITEREVEYKRKAHGKVNWNRTIKMTKPVVDEDESNLVYLDLIARRVNYNEDCLITLVHKFCVHDALNRLGFLFGIEPTEEPILDFEYELFCSAVNAKLSKTFNDRDLHLLSDLAKIIEFLAEHQTEDGINTEYYFGVNKFAPVWEAMVDKIFGKLPQGVTKDKFNPHCEWDLSSGVRGYENPNYAMRPDTIMWDGNNKHLYVLDAKYYKFGITGSATDLPSSGSICKQIAYAEYVETHWKEILGLDSSTSPDDSAQNATLPKPIYNVFVLPYCFDADNSKLPPDDGFETRPCKMRFIGYCHGDWKNIKAKPGEVDYRPYHRIAGILLDVKTVMQNYGAAPNAQNELAGLIAR